MKNTEPNANVQRTDKVRRLGFLKMASTMMLISRRPMRRQVIPMMVNWNLSKKVRHPIIKRMNMEISSGASIERQDSRRMKQQREMRQ